MINSATVGELYALCTMQRSWSRLRMTGSEPRENYEYIASEADPQKKVDSDSVEKVKLELGSDP